MRAYSLDLRERVWADCRAGMTTSAAAQKYTDFNPFEQAFANVKARLRAAELRAIDKVEGFFGTVHEALPPQECGNYIRHAGYHATGLPKAL